MMLFAPIVAALAIQHCRLAGLLPDARCTPGAVETTDVRVICGTSTRERRNVPDAVRRERFAAYGITWNDRRRFELDHLVPLEIGGSNTAANLWPEPIADAARKDRAENLVHRRVCRGSMTVDAAQRLFESDWTAALR